MAEAIGKAFGWDDTIENDGSEFTLLAPGIYPFRVVKFERAHYPGKAGGLPACPQAKLVLDVGDAESCTTIYHNLYLHSKCEGFLCAFFKAIGARQHGERLVMDWTKVVGATGVCQVGQRKYTSTKSGEVKDSNDIKRFLDPSEASKVGATAAPAVEANPAEVGADDIPF
jgi:hypothetical protein